MTKGLMFLSSNAFAKKISKLHWWEFAAGRLVGSMKNKQTVVVAAEKPSVTVCALVISRSLTGTLVLCSSILEREMVVMSAQ
jgi:hypothetical protein